MRRCQGIGDRNRQLEETLQLETCLRDQGIEGLAVHQLHRQEVMAVGLLHRMEGDDVGVVERRDSPSLPLEPLEALRI